jgi:hypothetical protein
LRPAGGSLRHSHGSSAGGSIRNTHRSCRRHSRRHHNRCIVWSRRLFLPFRFDQPCQFSSSSISIVGCLFFSAGPRSLPVFHPFRTRVDHGVQSMRGDYPASAKRLSTLPIAVIGLLFLHFISPDRRVSGKG